MKKTKVIILGSVLLVLCVGSGLFVKLYFLQINMMQQEKQAGDDGKKDSANTEKTKEASHDKSSEDGEKPIIQPEGSTLKTRVTTPAGYTRMKSGKGSLGEFLRNYPMKKDGSSVLLYDGRKKGNQNAHAGVFQLPLENQDLQQCADSVMRVYAEYFWKTKQKNRIAFHFVDGFLADYPTWKKGGRIQFGNQTTWIQSASYDDSYQNFKKYLRVVFSYASTISMKEESKKTTVSKMQIGDIFIRGGSPGHVVMIVDMCKDARGKIAFLLAQGYMPAQEFHLLKNPNHEEDPWYYEEELVYPFVTPEYTFEEGSLRHLKY